MHRRTGQPAPTFIQRHGLLIGTAVAAIAALAACTEEATEVELSADPKAAYQTALDDARREAKATHDAARREAKAAYDDALKNRGNANSLFGLIFGSVAMMEAKTALEDARKEAKAVYDDAVRDAQATLDAAVREAKAAYDDALSKPKAAYVAAVKKWRRGWRPTSSP